MISHVAYDSNNDIKMPPRMPKTITILARIENRPDAVIMYYAIAVLMFSPILRLGLGCELKHSFCQTLACCHLSLC